MKSIVLILLFASAYSFGQFSVFEKGEKTGLHFNGSEIVKAKYDSIALQSDLIATAYKKSNVYYIDQAGERVYKGKLGELYPFVEYAGLINKKEAWNVIKASGEKLFGFDSEFQPKVIGQFILKRNQYIPSTIYDIDGNKVHDQVKDMFAINNGLLIAHTLHSRQKKVKRKLIGTKTVTEHWTQFNLYNCRTKELIGKWEEYIDTVGSMFEMRHKNDGYVLIGTKGEVVLENYRKREGFSPRWMLFRLNEGVALIDSSGQFMFDSGSYERVERHFGKTFAIRPKSDSAIKTVDVYSEDGSVLLENIKFVQVFGDRMILQNENGMFFANQNGEQISTEFDQFFKPSNGMMRFFKDSTYAYMNEESLEVTTPYFPMYTGINYTRGRTGKGLGKLFGTNYTDQDWEVLCEGEDFQNGYAIVGVSHLGKKVEDDRSLDIGDEYALRYNFIDKQGNFFNSVKYKKCHPFRNGRAWVGEGSFYYTIDTNGRKYTKVKANVVEYIGYGYYLVEYNFDWGVVNDKFELVVPFKYHFRPQVDGRRIFEYKGIPAEEVLIYEIPE